MLLQRGAKVDAPEGYPLAGCRAERARRDCDASPRPRRAPPTLLAPTSGRELLCRRPAPRATPRWPESSLPAAQTLGTGAGDFTNPLIAATSNGYGDTAELLLQYRADPNAPGGRDGSTPLINAACTLPGQIPRPTDPLRSLGRPEDPDEDTALIVSALLGDNACVETLLNHGANVNLGGKHHGSALHAAAANGHTETCRLLLQRGADPRMRGGPTTRSSRPLRPPGVRGPSRPSLPRAAETTSTRRAATISPRSTQPRSRRTMAASASSSRLKPQLDVLPHPPTPATTPTTTSKVGTPLQAGRLRGLRSKRASTPSRRAPTPTSSQENTAQRCKRPPSRAAARCAHSCSRGARVNGANTGKYGHALVAAVARTMMTTTTTASGPTFSGLLLAQDGIPAETYKAALDRAFQQRDKEVFKQILAAMRGLASKDVKMFPNIKGMLARYRKTQRDRSFSDTNSDFGDDVVYVGQDIDDDEYNQEEQVVEDEEEKVQATQETTRRVPWAALPRVLATVSGPINETERAYRTVQQPAGVVAGNEAGSQGSRGSPSPTRPIVLGPTVVVLANR